MHLKTCVCSHEQQINILPPAAAAAAAAGPKPTDEASVFRYHPAFKFGEYTLQSVTCVCNLGHT
jgi:hypothetical protein